MILSLGRVISENGTMKDEIEKTLVIFEKRFPEDHKWQVVDMRTFRCGMRVILNESTYMR
jgi:hypothetical protein